MISKRMGKPDFSLILGTFLVNLLLWTLIVSTLLFAIGITVGWWNICLALLVNVLVCCIFLKVKPKQIALVSLWGLVIVAVTVFACHYCFDYSWDGNDYHKSMIGLMKYGWNPLNESFYDFARNSEFTFLQGVSATWYDAYPKMSEIWGACIYAFEGSIEDGKCYNLIATIGVFCIAQSALDSVNTLKRWQSAVCAFFCAMNPVIFSQMFTYYNDGFLWQMILLCTISVLYLTFFEKGESKKIYAYLIFASINIGFNIKFFGIIFYALLCLTMFLYWVISCLRSEKSQAEKKLYVRRRFSLFAISTVHAIVVSGATSYVTNTIRYRNPVYTMIGQGSTEIITSQLPNVYKKMGNITRFICSLLSKTSNDLEASEVKWKIPFTFDANEFLSAQINDVRTAGWGVLFSGIVCAKMM